MMIDESAKGKISVPDSIASFWIKNPQFIEVIVDYLVQKNAIEYESAIEWVLAFTDADRSFSYW